MGFGCEMAQNIWKKKCSLGFFNNRGLFQANLTRDTIK